MAVDVDTPRIWAYLEQIDVSVRRLRSYESPDQDDFRADRQPVAGLHTSIPYLFMRISSETEINPA